MKFFYKGDNVFFKKYNYYILSLIYNLEIYKDIKML